MLATFDSRIRYFFQNKSNLYLKFHDGLFSKVAGEFEIPKLILAKIRFPYVPACRPVATRAS